jgi:hypothetical protein
VFTQIIGATIYYFVRHCPRVFAEEERASVVPQPNNIGQ